MIIFYRVSTSIVLILDLNCTSPHCYIKPIFIPFTYLVGLSDVETPGNSCSTWEALLGFCVLHLIMAVGAHSLSSSIDVGSLDLFIDCASLGLRKSHAL